MPEGRELRFKIDAYTPSTIPMERLADYMRELAILLGEMPKVHFVRLEGGSTVLVSRIEFEAIPKVEERVKRVRRGDGPPEAMDAFRKLNGKLRDDNGVAVLFRDEGTEIIKFPGREAIEPVTFGAFNQEGSLDGVVILIGGKLDVVPVHLQTAETIHICRAERAVAKRLAPHLFESELRVRGTGRWLRDKDGTWILKSFTISDFEILNSALLSTVVEALRAVQGSEWDTLADPWSELKKIRGGPDGTD